jgi:hypothetical protein
MLTPLHFSTSIVVTGDKGRDCSETVCEALL